MRMFRSTAAAWLAAALLVACGGSDPYVPGSGEPSGAPTTKGNFTRVVSFGDSLSDAGAYAPATSLTGNGQPPYFGGRFTTNDVQGTTVVGSVWVENLATSLGLPITPHEVGFAGTSVKCPAAPLGAAFAYTCTAYGQGGSRVTDPNGIGNGEGFLTVPVVTQIQNHLTRFGKFEETDLILVFGGNNDVFIQFGAFVQAAGAIAANPNLTEDQRKGALLQAQLAAQGEMKKAALELSSYVREQILAKGGKYVAVANLPDSSLTPFGASIPAEVRVVLTTLVDTFNLWLRDGLTGQPVKIVDANATFRDAYLNPGKYGFTNNTVPACDADKIAIVTAGQVTEGSSLFCNATPGVPYNTLRDGADVDTWQFADDVHPTRGGHKAFSDEALKLLQSFGWL